MWSRRAAWVLLGVAVGAAVVMVVDVLPRLSWWPGWPSVGMWWATWWPAVVAGVAAVGAAVFWRRSMNSPTEAAAARAGGGLWVPDADGPGWVRNGAKRVAASSAARSGTAALRAWDWSKVASLITALTAVGALAFTAQSLNATRDQIGLSEQGQITDRYTAAVDQIGAEGTDHLETRLGGVYALERLMKDSPRDQPTIIEVLSAFVRSSVPRVDRAAHSTMTCAATPPSIDVQAALAVLGRRNSSEDGDAVIDLSSACLAGADLPNANLTHAYLIDADFTNAWLRGADLGHADLINANLINAWLGGADLVHADLGSADLTNAWLADANLGNADLTIANVTNAVFDGANLAGADLTDIIGGPLVKH